MRICDYMRASNDDVTTMNVMTMTNAHNDMNTNVDATTMTMKQIARVYRALCDHMNVVAIDDARLMRMNKSRVIDMINDMRAKIDATSNDDAFMNAAQIARSIGVNAKIARARLRRACAHRRDNDTFEKGRRYKIASHEYDEIVRIMRAQ